MLQQSPWVLLPASRNLQQVHGPLLLLAVQLLLAVATPFIAASGSPAVIAPLHDTKLTACRVVAGQ